MVSILHSTINIQTIFPKVKFGNKFQFYIVQLILYFVIICSATYYCFNST